MYSTEKKYALSEVCGAFFLCAVLIWSAVPFIASAAVVARAASPAASLRIVTLDPIVVTGHRDDANAYLTRAD